MPDRARPDRGPGGRPRGGPRGGAGRRRASHSLEAVIAGAIALLDEAGEANLTFRALAARLGGGVGSIYWYVSSKDELLDRATDDILGTVLQRSEREATGADPIANLRAMALVLYDAMREHPWLAAYLLRDTELQPNSMALYDRFGQQAQRLDLTTRQRFHAVSAIVNYVTGVGAELSQPKDVGEVLGEAERAAYLRDYAAVWTATDAERFPFLHEVADEFARHQDLDQFTAGLDLLLAGLRLQAGLH